MDYSMAAEHTAGGLGSGVLSAFMWNVLRSRWQWLPEMPNTVSPAVGAGLWGGVQLLLGLAV